MTDDSRIVPDLAFALVTGSFEPKLPSGHTTFSANNTVFQKTAEGYLLESYQLLKVATELDAPGVRLAFSSDGAITSAHVSVKDYLYKATAKMASNHPIWNPQCDEVDISFELSAKIGDYSYALRGGRFALVPSTLIGSID